MKIDNLPKVKIILFAIAMLLANIIIDGPMIYTPILAYIYEAFPDQMQGVNLFASLPQLMIIAASLATPKIMKTLGEKRTLVIFSVVDLVSGVLMASVLNIYVMALWNAVYAFACGVIMTGCVVVITDYIENESLRARILGYFTTAQSLCVAILSAVAGNLAVFGWRNAFLAYWLVAIAVLALVLFVPAEHRGKTVAADMKADSETAGEKTPDEATDVKVKVPFGRRFWSFLVILMLYTLSFYVFSWYTSMFVSENALGDAAFSGYVAVVFSVAGMLPGLVFGPILGKLKKRMPFCILILTAIGFVLMYLSRSSAIATLVSSALLGSSIGFMLPCAYTLSASVVPESKVNKSLGIINASWSVAGFATPYVVTWLMGLAGGYTILYPFVAIFLVVLAVAEFFAGRHDTIGQES